MGEERFLVVSLKHTTVGDKYITLWNHGDKGYTYRVLKAGRYTKASIEAWPKYYNDGERTIAVDWEGVPDDLVVLSEPGYLDSRWLVLPNTDRVWQALIDARVRLVNGRVQE